MYRLNSIAFAFVSALAAQSAFSATPEEIRQLNPQSPHGASTARGILKNPTVKEPDVEIYTAGGHYYKQAITSTKPRTTQSEEFIPLPGAKTRVVIPQGQNALVNIAFTAESRCNERHSNEQNWCEVRVLVDGTEAAPAASSFPPDTFAFDSTDHGTETVASWEAHAMDRHYCVENKNGDTSKVVPIEVHWKVTNFGGGNAPNFWLDDWSLTVELARDCRKRRVNLND